MLHPSEVIRRTELLEKVWDMHFDPESNVVDVHVGNLRRKLRQAGCDGLLQTVRGVGCAGNPAPVPVVGDEPTINRLEGEWTGIYNSRASGRSGSTVFSLVAVLTRPAETSSWSPLATK